MESPIDWSGAEFRKSTKSTSDGTDKCVEVAFTDAVVGVKDSKNRTLTVVEFSTDAWTAFLAAQAGRPAIS